MRPKTTSIAVNIPAFLSKLWKIVNDPDTNHLIKWSTDGTSFVIQNQAQFWYNLLPIYYKHNNMSSFIRQLNMYGFHKVSSENGGVECDKDELKFYHPFFQQHQVHLLKLIKRKMASTKTPENADEKVANVDQISKVLVDVKQLRGRQESVDNQLVAMKQENAALWQELALLRQKHIKQQQIVNKLIHFLVHIVNPPNRGGLGNLGVKRRYPLMINDARRSKFKKTADTTGSGPTIHELETESALINENKTQKQSRLTATSPLLDKNLLNIPIIDDSMSSPEMLLTDEDLENNAEKLLTENSPCSSVGSMDFPIKEAGLEEVITDCDIFQAANEYIDINNFDNATSDETILEDARKSPTKLILNPSMHDALISNLVSGTKSPDAKLTSVKMNFKDSNRKYIEPSARYDDSSMKLNSANDLDSHLETTQGELDSIKDMLFDGYSLDTNSLLDNQTQINNRFDGIPFQMFNSDGDFPLDVPPLTNPDDKDTTSNFDPMMSGSELTSYQPYVLDFENLFSKETSEAMDACTEESLDLANGTDDQNQLITPIVIKKEPLSFSTESEAAK